MRLPPMVMHGSAPAAVRPGAVVPAIPPPGNCTWMRHNQLMNAVNAHCRNLLRCEPGMSEEQLFQRTVAYARCVSARDQINDECFAGGDAGHREAADNAFRGRENCNEIAAFRDLRAVLQNQ